jgi:tyrosinase
MAGKKRATGVAKRPAIPPPIRTRKNAAGLSVSDPIITFYSKAIEAMKAKPIADPTSWRYQAAIHDYVRDNDPFAASSDKLPSGSVSPTRRGDQGKFWGQCQHGTSFFLPWHRMYLHHYERIVMGHVARLGGPSDWALPYWNYSASDAARRLPEPFRSATLPDGSTNHLSITERDPRANSGGDFSTATDTSLACLRESSFEAATRSFGGPRTRFSHFGNGGVLEGTPHGMMHVRVAGPTGFMRDFTKAPLDPIFWTHHCNIDRLWEVWLQRNAAHTNPTASAWLTGISFAFHDATGKAVNMRTSQVLDTKAAPLEYEYEDTSDPLGSGP